MWKAKAFPNCIVKLADSPIVSRIIVIDNNTAESVRLSHSKIDVMSMPQNIYVNPAWNTGVRRSLTRFTCLLNDDIFATHELLQFAVSILANDIEEHVGLIGMDWSSGNGTLNWHAVDWMSNQNFGAAMFFRTKDYRRIPQLLKIYFGDDYLVLRTKLQGKIVAEISGFEWSNSNTFFTTVSSDFEHFNPILKRDSWLWLVVYKRLLLLRFEPARTLSKAVTATLSKARSLLSS
jgi:hypothetical protein